MKYGICPLNWRFIGELELVLFCTQDEKLHEVQKCCREGHGYRCQISREYQRPGSCNTNIDLTGWVRMASCNDGIRCCYGGKCCKRYSNREVDTCSYPSYIGHYQGIPYVVCWSTVTHKERPIDHICEVCHGNNGSLMSSVQVCGVHDLRVV